MPEHIGEIIEKKRETLAAARGGGFWRSSFRRLRKAGWPGYYLFFLGYSMGLLFFSHWFLAFMMVAAVLVGLWADYKIKDMNSYYSDERRGR